MSLEGGLDALKQGHHQEAVQLLKEYCESCTDLRSKKYLKASMGLAKAYQGAGQTKSAITLCQQLASHEHPQVSTWARQALKSLSAVKTTQPASLGGENLPQQRQETSAEEVQNLAELFHTGQAALKQRRYPEAIQSLETFCQSCSETTSKDYVQAQVGLVKAYQRTDQLEKAITLCDQLRANADPLTNSWVQQVLPSLLAAKRKQETQSQEEVSQSSEEEAPTANSSHNHNSLPKAGRAAKMGIKLVMRGITANLALASTVTLGLLFGMVFVLCLSLIFIHNSDNPTLGLFLAVTFTLVFNTLAFFLSPLIMDLIQGWFYKTRWVSLAEVARYSPETAQVIQRVCREKKLKQPRLGIINDQNPTAFTYGSLPNSARLVVSQGIFTYLDDDEIATVYAHELGHIVHWDFAVMTLASTLVQITYLIYSYAQELSEHVNDKRFKAAIQNTVLVAYMFYLIGTYLLLYLSRTREYFADHFSAETTGNPNALSRALVKIAYGILEEGKRTPQPSKLIQGTRALGIYDPKAANNTATAYRVAEKPQQMGRAFLWDLFNPWAWWMELESTHPLTGKRVRALSTYAEQLGLETEFDMALVVREGNQLSKKRLYGNFFLDVLLYKVDILGAFVGLLIGIALFKMGGSWKVIVSMILMGFGFATLIKMIAQFPDFTRTPESNVLALMSDPYASPLRGQVVKLEGQIIGRGNAGYRYSCDLQLQDSTGMIYLHYASRFGPFGNFLFGLTQAENQIGAQVTVVGWFRRGMAPWVDLIRMDTDRGWSVKSYHRFWLLTLGVGLTILGFVFPSLF